MMKKMVCVLVCAASWCASSHVVAQPAPGIEEARMTALERYTELHWEMACNAQQWPNLSQHKEREAANEKTLRAYGMTKAQYVKASYLYGASPTLAREVSARLGQCQGSSRDRGRRGLFWQDFSLARGLEGQLRLVLSRGERVDGHVRLMLDGRPLVVEIKDQTLRNKKLVLTRKFAGKKTIDVVIDATLVGSRLNGTVKVQVAGDKPRSLRIGAAMTR